LLLLQLFLLANQSPGPQEDSEGYPIININSGERLALSDANFTQNIGSLLLHVSGYSFKEPIRSITFLQNQASGLLLQAANPKYNDDGVQIEGLYAEGNVLQTPYNMGKPPVGVLAFRGISTATGDTVLISISNSTIMNNWFKVRADQQVRTRVCSVHCSKVQYYLALQLSERVQKGVVLAMPHCMTSCCRDLTEQSQ
jgi:hypothetical protein